MSYSMSYSVPGVYLASGYPPLPAQQDWIRFVKNLSYKPNTRFTCAVSNDYVDLFVEMNVVNSYHPDQLIPLGISQRKSWRELQQPNGLFDYVLACAWVKEILKVIERHELDEWFRSNGVLVDDPHYPSYAARNRTPDTAFNLPTI